MKAQTTMAAKDILKSTRGQSSIGKNLVATLFSSWLMAPLGALVLHLTGLGSDRYLVTILVALGVGAPFQLMLNEFLAVGQARDRYADSKAQVAVLAVIHLFACLLALGAAQPAAYGQNVGFEAVMIAGLVTTNLIFSYASVWYYTRLVLAGRIGTMQSIANGGLTGGVTFLLYVLAAATGSRVFLTLVLVLPGLLHLMYFAHLYGRSGGESVNAAPASDVRLVSFGPLLFGSTILVGTTFIGSLMRFRLVENYPEYAAVLLIIVNVISTAAFTMTRFSFLSKRQNKNAGRAASGALVLFGLTVVSYLLHPSVAPIFAVVCINLINIWIIEALRHWSVFRRKV